MDQSTTFKPESAEETLSEVLKLEREGKVESAIDLMFDFILDNIKLYPDLVDNFVEESINRIDELSIVLLIGILTATLSSKVPVKRREEIYAFTNDKLKAVGKDPDWVLKGLF